MTTQQLAPMLIDDRERGLFKVNRNSFIDSNILALERKNIFNRCWLYAGHESEVKKNGDFYTRKVGGRPLLITRGMDGVVRTFLNTCTHRGNPVAIEKKGNARSFTCFYHAWSFDTKGELIGVPGDTSYTDSFKKADHGLKPVPQFDSYRGMLFVNFDADAVSLREYLGDEACKRLDYFIDFGTGEAEISPGAFEYSVKANWKLLVENSIDGYHALSTHQRYFRKYMPDMGVDPAKWLKGAGADESRAKSLGNGHAVIESLNKGTLFSHTAEQEINEIREHLTATHGAEYAHLVTDYTRNLLIYPNLILVSMFKTVRTFYPVTPDYMEVEGWGLFPSGDTPELRKKRIDNYLSFQGPGGMATPDDVSGLEGCQRGFETAQEVGWSDISRGMGTPTPVSTDELQMRVFWRKWSADINGEPCPAHLTDAIALDAHSN